MPVAAMQRAAPRSKHELPIEARELMPELRIDGVEVCSPGTMLEWLLAILHDDYNRTTQLVDLRWLPQPKFERATRLCCRARGQTLYVTLGDPGIGRVGLMAELSSAPDAPSTLPPWSMQGQGAPLDAHQFRAELLELGVQPSAVEPCDGAVYLDETSAWASLAPHGPASGREGFLVGPALLDMALQLALLVARRSARAPLSPWPSIGAVRLAEALGTPHALRVRTAGAASANASAPMDVALLDAAGSPLLALFGVRYGSAGWVHERARTRLGRTLRELVRSSLALPSLSDSTDLTALGASSLDLVRIAQAVQAELDFAPPLSELIAAPSVAGLIDLVLSSPWQRSRSGEAVAHGCEAALSSAELQLWFLEHLGHVTPAYNEGRAFRIEGALELDRLERALQHVAARHPGLRTVFEPGPDGLRKRPAGGELTLERRWLPSGLGPDALQRLLEDALRRPFDLTREPPLRCSVFVPELAAGAPAILLLCAHHIACDAWSLERVLLPALSEAYAARLGGESDEAQPLREQPRTRSRVTEAATARALSRLGGVPHAIDFPYDRPRPAKQTHLGARVHVRIDEPRVRALEALARELEVSTAVAALSIAQALLQRYTRQWQFCLGVPVSLRRDAREHEQIGCFVELAVVRAQLAPDDTFAVLCRRVKAELIEALCEGPVGLAEAVRALAPERSLSHTPLVQVVFGYREGAASELALWPARVEPMPVHNRSAKFDLAFDLVTRGSHAELALEYASDLLDRRSAELLLAHYLGLLDSIVASPGAALAELELADATESSFLCEVERGPAACEPSSGAQVFVPDGVLQRALSLCERADDDEAVVLRCGRAVWSAARLEPAIRERAARLERAGVRAGEFVALRLERGPEWLISVLAVLRLGAAYIPFDRSNPEERVRSGLARVGARAVIDQARGIYAPVKLEPGVAATEALGSASQAAANASEGRAPIYAILTSGSSGAPRMAAVARSGFDNLVAWYAASLQLRASDRVLVATSVGFDLTQKNVFAALACRAELIFDPAPRPDPAGLCDLIESQAVTVFNCTPSLAYQLVAYAAVRSLHKLRSLRVLVLGGEPIDLARLRAWTEHPSCRARILNSYGPSECSDVVAAGYVDLTSQGAVPIGLPIPNTRCRVVELGSHSARRAACGVAGELWIGGAALGLGYLGDAAATSERFVSDADGDIWYRSGDLVRRRPDGQLEFLGRLDAQLKLRGYRIEPVELEAALTRAPGVSEAAVVSSGSELVAFVAGSELASGSIACRLDPAAPPRAMPLERSEPLRRALAARVPSYMWPRAFFALGGLPSTASGKIDRQLLAALARAALAGAEPAGAEAVSSAPDGLCATVQRCWSAALGGAVVTLESDFFRAGGHSLAAIELTRALELALGEAPQLAWLFERPVLRDYVARLRAAGAGAGAACRG